jgi:hypothetical protein
MHAKIMKQEQTCKTGKKCFDKKGAITMRNSAIRLYHAQMDVYECYYCGRWHLYTTGERHTKFRYINSKFKRITK